MKKFGLNNKNLNPPWPFEQPVVIIPPGSTPAAIGISDEPLRSADTYGIFPDINGMSDSVSASDRVNNKTDFSTYENAAENDNDRISERSKRQTPLMGDDFRPSESGLEPHSDSVSVCTADECMRSYLCNRGKVRISVEFIGDRLPNCKKCGFLSAVGSDFITLNDPISGNTVVCPANTIKSIDIIED